MENLTKEILIEDIPEEGLSLSATEADRWLGEIVRETFGESFEKGDKASLKVDIRRIKFNVDMDGELRITSHPHCDRCLASFADEMVFPFHTTLAPLYESHKQREEEEGLEVELVREDLEFGYYEGDRFDLSEIVREEALLSQPMKRLCRPDCKGLCPKCGKDLNKGLCGCKEDHADPRWSVLKDVKIPQKTVKKAAAKPSKKPAKKKSK